MGSKGVDLPKIAQKLEKISTTKAFEPIATIDAYDVHSFLKNQRRNIILGILEEDIKHVRVIDAYDTWIKLFNGTL